MRKQIITIALTCGLIATSGGLGYAHYTNEELTESIENKNKVIDKKTTEIAKLEDVIVNKDEKLDADKLVIEKQKDQLEKKNNDLNKVNKKVKQLEKKVKAVENSRENFNNKIVRSDVSGSNIGKFEMTSYVAMCREGCTGITATGINIKNTTTYQGHRIIATDTSIIPLWSIVKIHTKNGSFTAISLDTGEAINGRIIDYLVSSESEARQNGRQMVSIEIIRRGK